MSKDLGSRMRHTSHLIMSITVGGYRSAALAFLLSGWLGQLTLMLVRNIGRIEPAWAVELVTLLLMYGSLLYIGLTPRHIGFELVTRKVAGKPVLSRVQPVVGALIVTAFLYESILATVSSYHYGGTIGTAGFNYPEWAVVLVVPIFSFALLIRLVAQIYRPVTESTSAVTSDLE